MIKKDKRLINDNAYSPLLETDYFNNPNLLFVFKKTERIISALYMITDAFSQKEPLKWAIRDSSTNLMADIVSVGQKEKLGLDSKITVPVSLYKVISFLDLSYQAKFVSPMNFQIVRNELFNLIFEIENIHEEKKVDLGLTDMREHVRVSRHKKVNSSDKGDSFESTVKAPSYKGHSKGQAKRHDVFYESAVNSDQRASMKVKNSDNKNEDRKAKIIQIVKDKKEVSVKDISLLITDFSEKTLQRELLNLVKDGVLKKEGERRWSRYSIA